MSDHHAGPSYNLPHLAPVGSTSGAAVPYDHDPNAPVVPFTDAQVDEYREQDRWLPVSDDSLGPHQSSVSWKIPCDRYGRSWKAAMRSRISTSAVTSWKVPTGTDLGGLPAIRADI